MTSRSDKETVFDIDFTALSRAVYRNSHKIFVAALLVGAITFAGLSTLTPRYASEARLLIGGKGLQDPFRVARDAQNSRNMISATMSEEGVASQAQILKSQDLAVKVINALQLKQRKEFNPSSAEPSFFGKIASHFRRDTPLSERAIDEKVLRAYSRSLEVVHPKKTRVLEVRFTSADPQLAAAMANSLSEFYLEWLSGQSISTNRSASNWLSTEIERLRVEVKNGERAVEDYKASKGFFVGGTQQTLLSSQELAEINSELAKAKALKSEAEARLQLVLANNAETSPDVVRSSLVQRLVEQRVRVERSVSANATLLRPAHPVMQKLNADLLSIKKQISSEISKLSESLQKEVHVATLREAAVRTRLDDLKSNVARSSDDSVELRSLERDAKSKRETLEFYWPAPDSDTSY